jgi:hypothetical protein
MSIRRRSAKRTTEQATATYEVSEGLPRLDRAFVISFLEIDPEVAAALNGEAPQPPVINSTRGPAQPRTAEHFDFFAPPARHAETWYADPGYTEPQYRAPRYEDEAQVVDITASVEPVAAWDDARAQKARRARRPKERKPSSPRTLRGKSRAAAAAERVAAIKEVKLRSAADRALAAQAVPPLAPEMPATVEEIRAATPLEFAVPVEEVEFPTQPAAPPAPAEIRPVVNTERQHLPVQYVNHEKLLVQAAQAGWKIPPATRRQWSYMNFTMPPDPKANMTPRQIKRQEWRDMIKYFRISPYKSHYREDQRATKRLLGQARRARLDVA